jgi:hypothetical protein
MRKNIAIINIGKLKAHERINKEKVSLVLKSLKKSGVIRNPIIADRRTLVILDGHHRLAALKKLKINNAPVKLVDYFSSNIKVYLRRKEILMNVIKYAVVNMGLSKKQLPEKSTRHVFKDNGFINLKTKNLA